MDGYRVSDVVERTGIPATTVRYYDDIGLVPAHRRSDAGYRLYDDRSVERLRFVGRARRLGLGLDECRELADLWDGDRCAPVQARLSELIAGKLGDTRAHITELTELAAQLEALVAGLEAPAPDGPCGDACTCVAEPAAAEPTIACTLAGADAVAARVAEWRAVLDDAVGREDIAGGARLVFPPTTQLAADVARLASAEKACCGFFTFTLRFAADRVELDIHAPPAGQPVVAALFGAGTAAS